MTLHLPDCPIAAVRTGQASSGGETVWDVSINPPPDDEALARCEKACQTIASSGAPAPRSGFDLYLDGDTLSYLKASCGGSDTRGRIFLSVHPADVGDLPAERREIGHESLNFDFAPPVGAVFNGKRSSVFVLAGLTVVAKSASWAKRNPENPANPDSDKDARARQRRRTRE